VVLKIKARDLDVMAVGDALASVCDGRLGDAVIRWRDRLGFADSHRREIEVYRQADARIRRHIPHLLGSVLDDESQLWALALERVEDATHMNGAADVASWDEAAVRAAIEGLASVQAVWYGRECDLRRCDWIGSARTASAFSEMVDLWAALAEHARASFVGWTDPSIVAIHRRLIAAISNCAAGMDGVPRTLIHNDFNPRNLCLRRTPHGPLLCVYDWELATIGAPQRDLAELLCFVCTPSITETTVESRIELHRQLLEQQAACEIDRTLWLAGFKSSLYEMLVDRLSMYALINRVRRQAFLPRVLRTWMHLYRMFPLDEAS
jgi:hypothetical protein